MSDQTGNCTGQNLKCSENVRCLTVISFSVTDDAKIDMIENWDRHLSVAVSAQAYVSSEYHYNTMLTYVFKVKHLKNKVQMFGMVDTVHLHLQHKSLWKSLIQEML